MSMGNNSTAGRNVGEYNTWEEYAALAQQWHEQNQRRIGSFAESSEQRSFDQSCCLPLPPIDIAPVLILPLRFHLARGEELGCSLTLDNCREEILSVVNTFWLQAGIQWFLEDVMEKNWEEEKSVGLDISALRDQIWSLKRDPATGQMAGKDIRRAIFLEKLLPNHQLDLQSYDVYFFDLVGQESQGCCISRDSHTIIMGHRSTKGYVQPTPRPLDCLGKTCAHELGHALGLGHPAGQRFRDGTSCTHTTGRNNLMTGGKDSAGGGGTLLEDWQIITARRCAEQFLKSVQQHST